MFNFAIRLLGGERGSVIVTPPLSSSELSGLIDGERNSLHCEIVVCDLGFLLNRTADWLGWVLENRFVLLGDLGFSSSVLGVISFEETSLSRNSGKSGREEHFGILELSGWVEEESSGKDIDLVRILQGGDLSIDD